MCLGCGNTVWATLLSEGDCHWWRCTTCGFARLIPMPDAAAAAGDEIGLAYIDAFRRKTDKKMRRSRGRVRRLQRRMRGARLLDVGANVGCLVEAGRRAGLETVGIELNSALAAYARRTYPDCAFHTGALEDAALDAASFDGIHCSEVIEHAPDNERFVAALARLLKPGGVLYLTTPAAHEYIYRSGRPRPRAFGAPDHKLYHTRKSLRVLLARHGFERIGFKFNFGRGHKLFAHRR